MKNVETLETEKRELHSQLRAGASSLNDNDRAIFKALKENETQLKAAKIQSKLNQVNKNQSRLRELAKIAWECETPNENITANDGSFHKTKVKKYPKLAALNYARAAFKDSRMTRLNIEGEMFYMYSCKYEYDKPAEYFRPETFADFLELNSIQPEDITAYQLAELAKANEELSQKTKLFIESLEAEYKKLNMYSMCNLTLFSQSQERVYNYRLNY